MMTMQTHARITGKQLEALSHFGVEGSRLVDIDKAAANKLIGALIERAQADACYRKAGIDPRGVGLDDELDCDGLIAIINEYGWRGGIVVLKQADHNWDAYVKALRVRGGEACRKWLEDAGVKRLTAQALESPEDTTVRKAASDIAKRLKSDAKWMIDQCDGDLFKAARMALNLLGGGLTVCERKGTLGQRIVDAVTKQLSAGGA